MVEDRYRSPVDPDMLGALADWTAAGIAFLALVGSVVGFLYNRREVLAAKADAAKAEERAERSAAAAQVSAAAAVRSADAAETSTATAVERATRQRIVERAQGVRWQVTIKDFMYLKNVGTVTADEVVVLPPAAFFNLPEGPVTIKPQGSVPVWKVTSAELLVAWLGHEEPVAVQVPRDSKLYGF